MFSVGSTHGHRGRTRPRRQCLGRRRVDGCEPICNAQRRLRTSGRTESVGEKVVVHDQNLSLVFKHLELVRDLVVVPKEDVDEDVRGVHTRRIRVCRRVCRCERNGPVIGQTWHRRRHHLPSGVRERWGRGIAPRGPRRQRGNNGDAERRRWGTSLDGSGVERNDVGTILKKKRSVPSNPGCIRRGCAQKFWSQLRRRAAFPPVHCGCKFRSQATVERGSRLGRRSAQRARERRRVGPCRAFRWDPGDKRWWIRRVDRATVFRRIEGRLPR